MDSVVADSTIAPIYRPCLHASASGATGATGVTVAQRSLYSSLASGDRENRRGSVVCITRWPDCKNEIDCKLCMLVCQVRRRFSCVLAMDRIENVLFFMDLKRAQPKSMLFAWPRILSKLDYCPMWQIRMPMIW